MAIGPFNGNSREVNAVNARTFWTLVGFNSAVALAFFGWVLNETSSIKADVAGLKEVSRSFQSTIQHIDTQMDRLENKMDRIIERENKRDKL